MIFGMIFHLFISPEGMIGGKSLFLTIFPLKSGSAWMVPAAKDPSKSSKNLTLDLTPSLFMIYNFLKLMRRSRFFSETSKQIHEHLVFLS
jgi:hypothetical protein